MFNNSIEPTDTKRSIDDIPLRNARVAEDEAENQQDVRRASSAPSAARKQADPLVDVVADKHNLYTHDKKFPTAARVYYSDYQQKQEVMRAKTNTIETKLDDRQTVGAMLDLAEARGWQSVKLRGTDEFKREAWVQAEARGMKTEGYKATNTDKQELERRVNVVAARSATQQAPAAAKPRMTSDRMVEEANQRQAAKSGPRDIVLKETDSAAANRVAAVKAKPLPAGQADGEDWRKDQEKAPAPTQGEQEKAVWTAKESQGKAAREADQPVQKPTEKAAEKPAVMAA